MSETVHIDYLILANHVEAVNGLLYMSGGGWTEVVRQLSPDGKPPITHLGIGISVAIPWNETNAAHHVAIVIEDDDGLVLLRAEATINVGRPPQLSPGTEQHIIIASPADLTFPHAGGYRIVLTLDEDRDTKMWNFRVHDNAPGPTRSVIL